MARLLIKSVVKQPFYEHGFWWWWDAKRNDWFVGCAPYYGIPNFALKENA